MGRSPVRRFTSQSQCQGTTRASEQARERAREMGGGWGGCTGGGHLSAGPEPSAAAADTGPVGRGRGGVGGGAAASANAHTWWRRQQQQAAAVSRAGGGGWASWRVRRLGCRNGAFLTSTALRRHIVGVEAGGESAPKGGARACRCRISTLRSDAMLDPSDALLG